MAYEVIKGLGVAAAGTLLYSFYEKSNGLVEVLNGGCDAINFVPNLIARSAGLEFRANATPEEALGLVALAALAYGALKIGKAFVSDE